MDKIITVKELLTIKEASEWASNYLKKNVTTSNISYLIQYGRIKKFGSNGNIFINKQDLIKYYDSFLGKREIKRKDQLGEDLNWALSFDNLKKQIPRNMSTDCIPTKENLFHNSDDLKEVNYENIHSKLNKILCRNN